MGDMGDTFRHPHMKRIANLFNSVNLVSGKSLLQTVSTLPVAEPVKPTPMKLRIFADIAASEEAMELLKSEVSDHELLLPENRTTSVLAQAEPDPQMLTADVIFGQPHPDFVSRAEAGRANVENQVTWPTRLHQDTDKKQRGRNRGVIQQASAI